MDTKLVCSKSSWTDDDSIVETDDEDYEDDDYLELCVLDDDSNDDEPTLSYDDDIYRHESADDRFKENLDRIKFTYAFIRGREKDGWCYIENEWERMERFLDRYPEFRSKAPKKPLKSDMSNSLYSAVVGNAMRNFVDLN